MFHRITLNHSLPLFLLLTFFFREKALKSPVKDKLSQIGFLSFCSLWEKALQSNPKLKDSERSNLIDNNKDAAFI